MFVCPPSGSAPEVGENEHLKEVSGFWVDCSGGLDVERCVRRCRRGVEWVRDVDGALFTPSGGSVCPSKGSPAGYPVAASHIRTVRSYDPVAMRVPSGERETEVTPRVCSLITV